MTLRRNISLIIFILAIMAGSFFYFSNRIKYSQGHGTETVIFVVNKGDNALDVSQRLQTEGLIAQRIYFIAYLWKEKLLHSLVAGTYELNPRLAGPEIAKILTGGQVLSSRVTITFPEGLTMTQMAQLISDKGLDGEGFLAQAKTPPAELKSKFDFLAALPKGSTLEGYLFPDTYFFAKDVIPEDIILKMLKNFDTKVTSGMRMEIENQNKKIEEMIIMASIIQGEVQTTEDMQLVGGVFWNRLAIGQRLQSDATLEYALGTNKKQHSLKETQLQSPYNTYQVLGLPPGPVSNPGVEAIAAAIYPQKSEFFYFLTNLETGETVFAKTFKEHVQNKAEHGL